MSNRQLHLRISGDGTAMGAKVEVVEEDGSIVGPLRFATALTLDLRNGQTPKVTLTPYEAEVEIVARGVFTVTETLPPREALKQESEGA